MTDSHQAYTETVLQGVPATELERCETADAAFARANDLYEEGLARTAEAFNAYADGTLPGDADAATYPYICVEIDAANSTQTSSLAFGKIPHTSLHGSSISAPGLMKDYLLEQLEYCLKKLQARVFVGRSLTPIPLTFAMERAAAQLTPERRRDLQLYFHLPNLAETSDDIVDGGSILKRDGPLPLTLFPANRMDYSLHRLRHYTATDPEHFQRFVLFTNYQRYVDEFVEFGRDQVSKGAYDRFVEPGNRISEDGGEPAEPPLQKLPQMPAYHLVLGERMGITLVNIGIGPSNAKTATDHLAVLRPHVWLMVGHCGGLRRTQR
ncbi:MAG: AMP nucleosidase, partial [Pseudomonadota bacterium]